ncbi:MAG: flagellar biosynthesis protein FlhA [Treponema sp.]|jgi:flagellar biosynthesis protein FlhA|nr:flagellar biosynthesis protein FlhA [Treponema sp.]
MANENGRGKVLTFIRTNMIGIFAVVAVLLLIIPIPKVFIDFLMIINLAVALLVLLTVVYTPRASDLSSFPQIILFVTLFGLGINISSTRLILSAEGNNVNALAKTQSAMVQAFADIVAGNSLVIGFVIFIILIVVQIVVITKGAGRVSEVAARFTLDSMQVKQLDIDNQLSNGYITEEEANFQKEQLRRDIDFYSNMDGSSKFVSGNVKAGIFITVINLVGGFIVGMVYHHLSFTEALEVYTRLTIGDGLLSQMPSLMLSFATGILVTADKSKDTLDEKVIKEFSIAGTIYEIIGGVLAAMGIVFRGGTQFLLIPVGAAFFYFGFRLSKQKEKEKILEAQKKAEAANGKKSQNNPEQDAVAPLDPLCLEIGFALIPLVDKEKGAELVERISRIRREAALDMGLPVPKIRIVDNMNLEPNEYCFKIRGIPVGRSQVRLGYYMCMNTGAVTEVLKGEPTKDPAFGMPAIWLPEDQRSDAEQAGYTVVDAPTIIATHLTEIIKNNAADILGRQEVNLILEQTKKDNQIIVDEILSGDHKFSIGEIEKILRGLLKEKVSIRNTVTILEAISNNGLYTRVTWKLIDAVRVALGSQICLQYADNDGKLRLINLSQGWCELLFNHAQYPEDGSGPILALDPADNRKWINAVSNTIKNVSVMGYMPIILCPGSIRMLVHDSIDIEMPGVVVLAAEEVNAARSHVAVEVLGEIAYEE